MDMKISEAEKEMVDGYLDGFDPDSPEPSSNRSHSYRHGFANGRRDRGLWPMNTTAEIERVLAETALSADCQN